MSSFFYNLGRQFGHKAVPAIRKSKYIWDGVAGTEDEALRAETALGAEMVVELHGMFEMLNGSPGEQFLADLTRRLSSCVRNNRRTFRCELFKDSFPNALALPGGFLFVSDSLYELCGAPDELAFIVGHEMAHVVRGHAWDRMFNEAMLKAVAAATARVGQLGAWVRQQGLAMLRNAHERDQEDDADTLGLRLAVAAGFDGNGAVRLLQAIGRMQPDPALLGQYLASHPAPHERLTVVRRVLRQATHEPPAG